MERGLSMERKRRTELLWILLWGVFLFTGLNHAAQAAPLAALADSTFDFGSVVEGTQIEHDFVLKNNGSEPLVIEKIVPG
jgi:Protein of unknown function (DUF1573)